MKELLGWSFDGALDPWSFFFSLFAFMFDIVFCFVSSLSIDLDGAI